MSNTNLWQFLLAHKLAGTDSDWGDNNSTYPGIWVMEHHEHDQSKGAHKQNPKENQSHEGDQDFRVHYHIDRHEGEIWRVYNQVHCAQGHAGDAEVPLPKHRAPTCFQSRWCKQNGWNIEPQLEVVGNVQEVINKSGDQPVSLIGEVVKSKNQHQKGQHTSSNELLERTYKTRRKGGGGGAQ